MKRQAVKTFLALLSAIFLLTGCGGENATGEQLLAERAAERAVAEEQAQDEPTLKDSLNEQVGDIKEDVRSATDKAKSDIEAEKENIDLNSGSKSSTKNTVEDDSVPADSYILVSNEDGFTEGEIKSATHNYLKLSKLDALDRAGAGIGVFAKDSIANNGREKMDEIHPLAWHHHRTVQSEYHPH